MNGIHLGSYGTIRSITIDGLKNMVMILATCEHIGESGLDLLPEEKTAIDEFKKTISPYIEGFDATMEKVKAIIVKNLPKTPVEFEATPYTDRVSKKRRVKDPDTHAAKVETSRASGGDIVHD